MKTVETRLRAIVHLKTHKAIDVSLNHDRKFDGESLTAGTLQTFFSRDQSKKYFVQGDNIAYVEVLD